jgi:hypothetical protein
MFDATHIQNVQPTATVNVAEKSNFQAPITKENSTSTDSTSKRANIVAALEILWNLDFVTWNFPGESRIPRGADCSSELQ